MSCDFLCNDGQIVCSTVEGEIDIYSLNRQKRIWHHETLPGLIAEWEASKGPEINDVPV
jgi:hypothetical protein